ncbi:MAG TPA: glycosyl hydrolase 53 family protein [Cyclobacteriaceae bacterium]|nr:glycosyl hydrolase 53 family protein [Cyclobacteriaceae bacterium]
MRTEVKMILNRGTASNSLKYSIFLFIGIFSFSCSKSQQTPVTPVAKINLSKGADVSWLSEMEAAGIKFYDSTGAQQDCMAILKSLGINSIRLRAWVRPAGGWNNTADLVAKAKRAKNLGMKLMIDFHYSDTWADPGHQTKPAAWSGLSFSDLQMALYNYTKGVMDTLNLNGIIPNWVQIGNETNDGMLWPDGGVSANQNNFSNFAALVTQGYNAVKAVSDTTKIIVHISNGYDNGLFRWMFDGLTSSGAKFDIIGMSLYPSYTSTGWAPVNFQCLTNMNDMISRYNKPVMIVEAGMPENDPGAARSFLSDIISKTKSVANGNGLGVFYWEPECYGNWNGYGLGAFDNSGKPTAALNAFH